MVGFDGIVDRSPGYSELANPRSRIFGGDDHAEFGAPTQPTSAATAPASAATAPALMDHLAVGPAGSQAPASSASSWCSLLAPGASSARQHHRHHIHGCVGVTVSKEEHRGPCRQLKTAKVTRVTNSRINIGYDGHRAAPTAELHSSLAHDIGHVIRSYCPMQWKSWKVMPDETKTAVRGQLSDLDEESLAYVNRLFSERYKQWKSDLHHHFEAFDDPQVLFKRVARKSLRGGRINKAKVNKGNRKKKTLLHHSGSRPFSYRMDARRGSKFPEIDVFGNVYVRPGNELAESLHTTMVERSQLVLQESASQLPPDTPIESVDPPQDAGFQILTETLDQTLGRRPGTYCRGMGNAREGTQTPFISAVKQSGHCFDSIGGHSSEPDVGHSAVPRTVRHSSPAF
ncbi:Ankyrin repeat family protein [Prunus dulcis]|uniref:Ankyrin repeat family protein n=1 Tax=Prunus dulcis TaxID=3755 RepID=A0A4Y1QP38_PRUDU|nr:Ankyrin repeat family protein [Prunus dulcis]